MSTHRGFVDGKSWGGEFCLQQGQGVRVVRLLIPWVASGPWGHTSRKCFTGWGCCLHNWPLCARGHFDHTLEELCTGVLLLRAGPLKGN